MKIIDILNKIANGEEPPKKIIYKGNEYSWYCSGDDYYCDDDGYLFDEHVLTSILNDEVEILETTITYNQDNIQHKKIEPLKYEVVTMFAEDKPIKEEIYIDNKDLLKTISEIIDRVNEL